MDMGNRLMGCGESWTFLLLAGLVLTLSKRQDSILVSMWLSKREHVQILLSGDGDLNVKKFLHFDGERERCFWTPRAF